MTTVRHLLDRKGRAIFSVGPEDPVLEAIRLMAEHPNLVKRPLLVRDAEIVFGFNEDSYRRALRGDGG